MWSSGPLDYSEEDALFGPRRSVFLRWAGMATLPTMIEALEETAIPFVLYKDSGFTESDKRGLDAARLKSAGLMGIIQQADFG